jgi:hypothetical protein
VADQGESAVGLLSQAPAANKDMRATKDDFLYLERRCAFDRTGGKSVSIQYD